MQCFTFNFIAMTTYCEIHLYHTAYEKALSCFNEIKQNTLVLEKKYNFYNKSSYLHKHINMRNRNKISIDKQSAEILKKIHSLSTKTRNYFDITTGTLNKCYEELDEEKFKKSYFKLKDKIGINTWRIDNNNLHFQYKETKIDLGGVIKEYSVDEAIKIIKNHNIQNALVNFGGDIASIGTKNDKELFTVGIKNPEKKDENLLYLQIKNQALTTSASYERNITIGENNYSHIKSFSSKQDILSATVISDTALEAGVYSTSLMIDPDISFSENLKVLLIDKDMQVHQNIVT